MNNSLSQYCESFINCRTLAEKSLFKWGGGYTLPACASILSSSRKPVTDTELLRCRDLIKANTKLFSNFRGIMLEPMSCMLAVADDPEKLGINALAAYGEMRKHFRPSDYLVLVALIVARLAEKDDYADIAGKTRAVYECMKEDHPFLTSSEDGPFAAMMVFSGKSAADICADAEECYNILRAEFPIGDGLQSASHVLTLGEGSAHEKCGRLTALYDALKMRGYKYGKNYEFPVLASLSILPIDISTIADDIVAAADMLKGKRGYGVLGAVKTERLMHAAMIVGNSYIDESGCTAIGDASVSSSISAAIVMAAAQQAAICAAITTAAAANSVNT